MTPEQRAQVLFNTTPPVTWKASSAWNNWAFGIIVEQIRQAEKAAAEREREACAQIAAQSTTGQPWEKDSEGGQTAKLIAARIRERSETNG